MTERVDRRDIGAQGQESPGQRSAGSLDVEAAERLRRQRMRSIAIAVSLALLVALFYAATIVRLGGNVLNRPY